MQQQWLRLDIEEWWPHYVTQRDTLIGTGPRIDSLMPAERRANWRPSFRVESDREWIMIRRWNADTLA